MPSSYAAVSELICTSFDITLCSVTLQIGNNLKFRFSEYNNAFRALRERKLVLSSAAFTRGIGIFMRRILKYIKRGFTCYKQCSVTLKISCAGVAGYLATLRCTLNSFESNRRHKYSSPSVMKCYMFAGSQSHNQRSLSAVQFRVKCGCVQVSSDI